MKIVTTIDVPDYVYRYFLKEAEAWPTKTPEDMMAGYLARYVRQKLRRQAEKQDPNPDESK